MQEYSYKKSFLVFPLFFSVLGGLLLFTFPPNKPIYIFILFIFTYYAALFLSEYSKKIILEDKYISVSMIGGVFKRKYKYEDMLFLSFFYSPLAPIVFIRTKGKKDMVILALTSFTFGLSFNMIFMRKQKEPKGGIEKRRELMEEIKERARLNKRSFFKWYK